MERGKKKKKVLAKKRERTAFSWKLELANFEWRHGTRAKGVWRWAKWVIILKSLSFQGILVFSLSRIYWDFRML